jgi:hypothetical protein
MKAVAAGKNALAFFDRRRSGLRRLSQAAVGRDRQHRDDDCERATSRSTKSRTTKSKKHESSRFPRRKDVENFAT